MVDERRARDAFKEAAELDLLEAFFVIPHVHARMHARALLLECAHARKSAQDLGSLLNKGSEADKKEGLQWFCKYSAALCTK